MWVFTFAWSEGRPKFLTRLEESRFETRATLPTSPHQWVAESLHKSTSRCLGFSAQTISRKSPFGSKPFLTIRH